MLNLRPNFLMSHNPNQPQSTRNKNTVKKQFLHPLIRMNEHLNGKQNQYRRSNLIQNLIGKDTVRKQNETFNEYKEDQYFCSNHSDRTAEYMVKIQDEMLTYCRKCATQVASQGFQVHKIITSPIQNLGYMSSSTTTLNLSTQSILLPNISPSRRRPSLTHRSSQNLNQKCSQLHTLTQQLKQIKSHYQEKSCYLEQICNTFSQQKQTLNDYYSQLISYIQQIRDSHIQAIEDTSVSVVQVCEIENGEIGETLKEIDQMIDDIEGNFEMIIEQVDELSYCECHDFYKQKACIFSHRLEELGAEAKPWPCTSQEEISNKIHSFKSFVNELHEVHDEDSSEQNSVESFVY